MQDRKINVMHIIGDLDRAGAQEVVRTLVEYLSGDSCTPFVCTLRDGPLRQDIEELGVVVDVLGARRYPVAALPWFLADMIRIRRQLAGRIRKYNVDIIQTHLLGILDFLTLTLRLGTGLRAVLWTMHNIDFLPKQKQQDWILRFKRFVHRLLYRLAASQISAFIAVSDEVGKSVIHELGPIQDKVVVISNGVDVKRYERPGDKTELCRQLGHSNDSYLAGVVGRLTAQKGHRYLIDAASVVIGRYPNAHFLLVGEGELQDDLQAQVRKLGLVNNVHFLGNRDDVPSLLASVDLFVLPSLWEGLAMALLEAMAVGKPVVATTVSGTSQAMISGQTGLLVPPGESQALAEAIIQLISDPTLAQAMGQAAKHHVTLNYSAQKQADEHLSLYRDLAV
jgi:glycosyltransferase involved in cell wall biosynthesis